MAGCKQELLACLASEDKFSPHCFKYRKWRFIGELCYPCRMLLWACSRQVDLFVLANLYFHLCFPFLINVAPLWRYETWKIQHGDCVFAFLGLRTVEYGFWFVCLCLCACVWAWYWVCIYDPMCSQHQNMIKTAFIWNYPNHCLWF